jgi:hypothetical protein
MTAPARGGLFSTGDRPMIAFAKTPKKQRSGPAWHKAFLQMLPAIRRSAKLAFRGLPVELRDDLVEEVVANAFVAYARVVKAGKAGLVGPTPLSRYAIAQIRDGRRVGNRRRIRDAMSRYAQYHKGFSIASLDHSIAMKTSGEKSCWKIGMLGRPRLRAAGSILRVGSACCRGDSGRSRWRWHPAKRPAPLQSCLALPPDGFRSFACGSGKAGNCSRASPAAVLSIA